MSKALYATGGGDVMIWDKISSDNPDTVIGDPNSYIERIKFHSAFRYLKATYFFQITINHPLVSGSGLVNPISHNYTLYAGPIGTRMWLFMDSWGPLAMSGLGGAPLPNASLGQAATITRENADILNLNVYSAAWGGGNIPAWSHTFTGIVVDSV